MPQTCTICSHKKRSQIEAALVSGGSLRNVAKQFNISYTALFRHKNNCIKPVIEQVVQERQAETKRVYVTALDRVLRDLQLVEEALDKVWKGDVKDLDLLLRVLPESRQQNKLYAELTGELKKQINLTASPEWQEVMSALFARLAAYPDAHQSMVLWLEEERAKRRSA